MGRRDPERRGARRRSEDHADGIPLSIGGGGSVVVGRRGGRSYGGLRGPGAVNGHAAGIASEMLGHSTIAITLDLYSHVTPTMQEGAAEAMDTLVAK